MDKKTKSGIFWGIIVLVAGIILCGNVLELWEFTIFFPGWWTLFLIIPAIYLIYKGGANIFSVSLLVVGVAMLLSHIPVLSRYITWKLILPLVIIAVGVRMIVFAVKKNGTGKCAFGGHRHSFHGKLFEGGDFSCAFGQMKIDLCGSIINQSKPFRVDCSFGEVDIYVPIGVSLDVKQSVVFGAVENNFPKEAVGVPLDLEVKCAFGEVNIIRK